MHSSEMNGPDAIRRAIRLSATAIAVAAIGVLVACDREAADEWQAETEAAEVDQLKAGELEAGDGGTGPIEPARGVQTAEAQSETQDRQKVAGKTETADRSVGDEPSAREAGERPAQPLECAGWMRAGARQSCMYVWSECADNQVREVRCDRDGDRYQCLCILGSAQIRQFTSPDFCQLGGNSLSVDRAIFTEVASEKCGWTLGPTTRRRPTSGG